VLGASFANSSNSIVPSVVSKVALYDFDTSISIGGAELYCLMTRTSLVGVLAGRVGVGFIGVFVGTTIVGTVVAVSSLHAARRGNDNRISVLMTQNWRITMFESGRYAVIFTILCKVVAPSDKCGLPYI